MIAPHLAGPYVGYAFVQNAGPAGETLSSIRIKDLRDGKTYSGGTACDSPPLSGQNFIYSLQLKDNRSVAWINDQSDNNANKDKIEVCAQDSLGRRQLDAGAGIDRKSLRLDSSTLTWSNAGVLRSAPLN